MNQTVEHSLSRTLRALEANGLLLESDPRLPSVTRIIVGHRLHSSWWAHPKVNLIYDVLKRLDKNPDVLKAKLVGGKVTYMHRKLWPAIFALGTSGEPWQRKGLSRTGKLLLAKVTDQGMLETTRLPGYASRSKLIGAAARDLERRLLVYGEDFHTSSGAHAKRLLTWQKWADREGFSGTPIKPSQAKARLEQVVDEMAGSADFRKLLPWVRD